MRNLPLIIIALSLGLGGCNIQIDPPIQFAPPDILQFEPPPGFGLGTQVPAEIGRDILVTDLVDSVSSPLLSDNLNVLAAIHSRHVNSLTLDQAAEFIFNRFSSFGGRWQVSYDDFPLRYDAKNTTQKNVIAILPGNSLNPGILIVGAHYDSRTGNIRDASSAAPGADDNASGVAALFEIARILRNENPQITILLAAFAAEEVQTVGSSHLLRELQDQDKNILGMISLDIIGNQSGDLGQRDIRVYSSLPSDSPSRQLANFFISVGSVYVPEFNILVKNSIDRPGRYSDHVPFSNAGVPSVRLIEGVESPDFQHTPLDLPSTIDAQYHLLATRLALAAIIHLAYGLPVPTGN